MMWSWFASLWMCLVRSQKCVKLSNRKWQTDINTIFLHYYLANYCCIWLKTGAHSVSEQRLQTGGGTPRFVRSALGGPEAPAGPWGSQQAAGGGRTRRYTRHIARRQLRVVSWHPGETPHQEKSPEVDVSQSADCSHVHRITFNHLLTSEIWRECLP